jgi:hypothetical protein
LVQRKGLVDVTIHGLDPPRFPQRPVSCNDIFSKSALTLSELVRGGMGGGVKLMEMDAYVLHILLLLAAQLAILKARIENIDI